MFKKYVFPRKWNISFTFLIKMISTLFGIAIPAILAYIIDDVVPTRNVNMVLIMGATMMLAAFLEWILSIYSNRTAAKISSETIKEIRQDLFERSINLSSRQIDELQISSLESRLTSDTYSVHNFLGMTMRMGARSVMLFFGGVFFCVLLSPRLSLVILVSILPIFLTIRLIFNKTRPMWKSLQEKVDEMVQVIREGIRGIKVSKALNKVNDEKKKFYKANDKVRNEQVEANYIMSLAQPIVNTILYSGLGVVILYGGYLITQNQLKVGTIIAFMSYFIQITNSLFMLNWFFNIYSRAMTSVKRIEEVIFMPIDESQMVDNPVKLPKSNSDYPEVEFKNVSFAYDGMKNSLSNINFKLMKSEKLGILGATGAGKSTIIKLLLRQYDVDAGEILIRGVNIKNIDPKDLNNLFGSVFQNDFIFKGTIKENIDFGRNIDDFMLSQATVHAQASEFIEEKDDQLGHKLSSKGSNLSGGQKQRVLLSRAIANNPSILILDDSSSALDFKTDAKLRKAIESEFNDSTGIIIAQRISAVINCEQIIFLEDGEIIAKGNHDYMIKNCEPYQEIAEMQIGEME